MPRLACHRSRGPQPASRATDPFSRPAEPPLMLPNDPSTRNTFEALDEDASDLDFDLDSLLYSKPESHIKARLIIEDFLDIKKAIARDLDDLRNLTITKDVQQRKEKIEEAIRHKEELKAARQSSKRSSRDSLPSPVPLLLQLPILSPKEHAKKYEQAPAGNPNDLDGSDGDPERGNRRGSEWNRHGRRGRGHGGPTKGQGNEPPRDLGRGYEPLDGPGPNRPLINTPFSTRVLAKHSTPAYGTPGAPDDDDFPELGTADPYPKAKELALFARSFLKELKYSRPKNDFNTRLRIFADHACRYGLTIDDYLAAFSIMLAEEAIEFYYNYEEILLELIRKENPANSLAECFEKLEKELRAVQKALRLGLRDDRSFANKLYSAYKNVPETTIARMNPAITSTAAIADIRRAIAFATEII
ncbi:hypothetical protein MBM_09319 [Drepanopeziza brunnea f. sp. 'multigermtubi' MB_m1]|uniref:Uncharacterized protein n=1 Tax=Marssonina brunnea f. sp. multigermtubi (strain MB_m1) TaxID=1072389 RepID=K1WV86_MARBU|nr:uncharacterized protein MBM_09319 [Drepanopeziza brunnea f. sp. 'multigermtubi' MB_m1]EKD12563.1 hypothetical protein MBM_09319 [Drepanopeziza brunnea f. sp. 'multigermtubi' MB_m1]